MDKNFLIIANWKANNVDPKIWFDQFKILNLKFEIAVAAPYLYIAQIPEGFSRAAQNVSSFPSGACTGEVSAQMLKGLQVKYCLLGHSERRKYLHETNDDVSLKFEELIRQDITPIICAQNFAEIPLDTIKSSAKEIYVMYEPFEAISTDGNYHPEPPNLIAQILVDWHAKLPEKIKFLYGGSVNPENTSQIISSCPVLSGFVVGHASLDPNIFSSVVNSIPVTS